MIMLVAHRYLTVATIAIAIALPLNAEFAPASAPAKPGITKPSKVATRFTRPPLPKRGAPGNAGRGAGTRACMTLAKKSPQPMLNNLNALVPEERVGKVTHVWGLTTLEHPTLWFYIPYDNTGIDSVSFTLQDNAGQMVQKVSVPIPARAGLVSVQLPETKPGLQVGNIYNWFFTVHGKCPGDPRAFVEGWIERTSLDAATRDRLQQASPQQKAELFAAKGIWYDALNTLAELRRVEPDNATAIAHWAELLKQSDMEPLSIQAIVQ
ncbi:MAG: DUF928 domain-containing protein [Oscillatoriales cyanobacterium C42_A2020_001]|nr:DUF928 domain-containing protein [Leptolyngbyaceae cyanobacterium C42_A2020_001]